MKKKFYFLPVLFYLLIQMNAFSQDGYILNVASSQDDSTIIAILETKGYTVLGGDYSNMLTPEKLDSVNNADLVIISRNASTWVHGEPGANPGIVEQWAEVTAPILCFSPWMLRANRWQCFNSSTLSCHGSDSILIPIDAQDHPIYTGVDVSSGFLQVLDTGRTRNEKFSPEDDQGNPVDAGYGYILALDPTDEGIIAAEWEYGVPYYDGSPVPMSNRLYLGFVTEGDNCQVQPNIMSAFNGNDDGKTILLNAVAYMLGEPLSITDIDDIQLNVYPNPVTDLLTIQGLTTLVNFEIINITGTVVLSGVTKEKINISGLQSGIYVLRTDANRWIKFIKK